MLGSYHRQIKARKPAKSIHFQRLRHYPATPRTLGESLRKKRIDLSLSMTQLAKLLGLGITDTAIEKWEKNQNRPTESHRSRLIEVLGFDPAMPNMTGES